MHALRTAALFALAVLFAAGCASPRVLSTGSGWMGHGGVFSVAPGEGVAWSFAVEGPDLVLVRDGARITVVGAVGEDGVRFQLGSMDAPEIVFEGVDGRRVNWNGEVVDVAGTAHEFGSEPLRIPRSGS